MCYGTPRNTERKKKVHNNMGYNVQQPKDYLIIFVINKKDTKL